MKFMALACDQMKELNLAITHSQEHVAAAADAAADDDEGEGPRGLNISWNYLLGDHPDDDGFAIAIAIGCSLGETELRIHVEISLIH